MNNIHIKAYSFLIIVLILSYSCSCKRSFSIPKTPSSSDSTSKTDTSTTVPPSSTDSSKIAPTTVTITVTFSSSATGASSAIAPLKYNKTKWMSMNFDDAALCVPRVNRFFKTKTYTDGCGNSIPYTSGIAVIGSYTYDTYISIPDLITNPQRQGLSYTELAPLIADGWDIENHTQSHSNTKPDGTAYTYADYKASVDTCTARILKYNHYKANFGVVPTNFYAYYQLFKNGGLLGGTSQGWASTDAGITLPALWDGYNKPKRLNQIVDSMYKFFPIQREFAVGDANGNAWYAQGTTDDWDVWGCATTLLNSSVPGYQLLGTHSFDSATANDANFKSWVTYVHDNGGNNLAFTSSREILEYLHLKKYVTKTESVNGNTLLIKIDYTSVPNKNLSWYDLSFLVSSGGNNIQSVSCSDKSFSLSYNTSTNLINIKKRITVW